MINGPITKYKKRMVDFAGILLQGRRQTVPKSGFATKFEVRKRWTRPSAATTTRMESR